MVHARSLHAQASSPRRRARLHHFASGLINPARALLHRVGSGPPTRPCATAFITASSPAQGAMSVETLPCRVNESHHPTCARFSSREEGAFRSRRPRAACASATAAGIITTAVEEHLRLAARRSTHPHVLSPEAAWYSADSASIQHAPDTTGNQLRVNVRVVFLRTGQRVALCATTLPFPISHAPSSPPAHAQLSAAASLSSMARLPSKCALNLANKRLPAAAPIHLPSPARLPLETATSTGAARPLVSALMLRAGLSAIS